MQKLVNCRLVISSYIGDKKECSVIVGKGYYKNDNEGITVYFSNDDIKCKYVYIDDCLTIFSNDSTYVFKENSQNIGKIKNGEYIFELATFATKIEVKDNLIVLQYTLSQQGNIIGKYSSELSFD